MPYYTRELTKTFDAGATPRLDLRTVNGAVSARGEDRQDVRVIATVRFRAETDEEVAELQRAIDDGMYADGDRVSVHAPEAGGGSFLGVMRGVFRYRRHLEIDLDVRAPRGASLTLHHVNRPVELRQLGGDIHVHMVNGRFEVIDAGGDLDFYHVNGHGSVRNVAGAVEMHYTNGHVEVERVAGDTRLHLVNGRVDVLDAGASVSVKGVSGTYSFSGPVRGDVTMSNAHGRITLNVPRDSRFRLDAQSAIGQVSSELEVRDGGDGLGDAPRVSLRSETGRIELRQLRQAEPAGV
jgi:hypothetical protein